MMKLRKFQKIVDFDEIRAKYAYDFYPPPAAPPAPAPSSRSSFFALFFDHMSKRR